MINEKKVVALIPARSGSKGIPGKNLKVLAGKPLVAWPINSAKKSTFIDKIIVSTDSEEIAKVAQKFGAEVPFLRPVELANDIATTFSVIEHMVSYLLKIKDTYDYLVLLEPTSPLTTEVDVDKAIVLLEKNRDKADAIVGVSLVEASHPAYCLKITSEGLINPFRGEFSKPIRRQDIDKLFFKDGSLYISDINVLMNIESFYHKRTLPYIVPKWKSFEVDDMVDFVCIEAIIKNMASLKKENYE